MGFAGNGGVTGVIQDFTDLIIDTADDLISGKLKCNLPVQ